MLEINWFEIVLAVTCMVQLICIASISRKIRNVEIVLASLGRIVMKDKIKNFEKGLENLFNPKDKPDVKNTRTNRKTK